MSQAQPNIFIGDATAGTINASAAVLASAVGHQVIHFIYQGSGQDPFPPTRYLIDDELLKDGNQWLLRANKSMHRSLPRQGLSSDAALPRDLYLVRYAHRLYTFGLFTQDASLLKIASDTAWAAQMYVDRFLYDQEPMELCELYMFDLKSQKWWQWSRQWQMVESVPNAKGVYTVLGSDRMTNAGKEALNSLFVSL